ncbi:MAG: hypothetical protein JST37_00185 [Bacteroidetes bacterium]|jgi:hypothetical protein|nr:hypothetical protein [Bacteroidota bacterium]
MMDDLRIIFWVIVAVIYIVSKLKGKKPEHPSAPKEQAPEPEKGMTFEELLREIQGSKSPAPPIRPAPVINYEEEEESVDEKPLEQADYTYRNQDKIYETYEKAKQDAFLRPSMEETLKLENTIVRYGQFKNYLIEEHHGLAAQYAQDLRDPANFKKALILGEILNRRF